MSPYVAIIHRKPHEGYSVSFPDVPGCVSGGNTVDEAMRAAGKALSLHLTGLHEAGEAPPVARDFAAVIMSTDSKGALAFILIQATS
jgi:predicted RNase H-like HicB family nuclease